MIQLFVGISTGYKTEMFSAEFTATQNVNISREITHAPCVQPIFSSSGAPGRIRGRVILAVNISKNLQVQGHEAVISFTHLQLNLQSLQNTVRWKDRHVWLIKGLSPFYKSDMIKPNGNGRV